MKKNKLPVTEHLDFAYLLELMPPLHQEEEYALLPELFAIIGHESLLQLCKYAGGQTIKIPTLSELADSISALQWFYDVEIRHTKDLTQVPKEIFPLVDKISRIYDVRNNTT